MRERWIGRERGRERKERRITEGEKEWGESEGAYKRL